MNYEEDWKIVKNTGRAIGAVAVDIPVAIAQDTVNSFSTLISNAKTFFAPSVEWEKSFSKFGDKIWDNDGAGGGIKQILIDTGNEFFSDFFSWNGRPLSINYDSQIIKDLSQSKNPKEFFSSLSNYFDFNNGEWRNSENQLLRESPLSVTLIQNYEKEFKKVSDWVQKNKSNLKVSLSDIFINNNIGKEEIETLEMPKKNQSLEKIFNAGPLLFSNMFDVAIILELKPNSRSQQILPKDSIIFLKNVLDSNFPHEKTEVQKDLFISDFSVRCAKISIPFPVQTTFQTKVLGNTIERASSFVEFNNQATLTIDMDSNLYYLDLFNALAGHRNNGSYNYLSKPKEINAISAPNLLGNPNYNMSLAITSKTLHNFSSYRVNPAREGINTSNICYIFSDIRFLGTDAVSFNKTSSGTIQMGFDFIFKNIETLYKSNEGIERVNSKDNTVKINNDQYSSFRYDRLSMKNEVE